MNFGNATVGAPRVGEAGIQKATLFAAERRSAWPD